MPVTWDSTSTPTGAYNKVDLSNGGLTAALQPYTVGIAVDLNSNFVWFYDLQNNRWNHSGTADPATGVGGISLATLIAGGALYPGLSVSWNGFAGGLQSPTINFGTTAFSFSPPSGFSAWGSGATLDPAHTGTGGVLSNGNLTLTNPLSGGWLTSRGTVSQSAGKWYFEATITSYTSTTYFEVGLMNGGESVNNYLGSSTNSVGWQGNGNINGVAGTGDAYPPTPAASISGIATLSRNSGKWYFEGTATNMVVVTYGLVLGLIKAGTLNNTLFVGDISGGIGSYWGTNVINQGGSAVGQSGAPAVSTVQGCAVDLSGLKVWFWNSATTKWNNDILANENPATGTGGISLSPSGTYFPAFSLGQGFPGNNVITANFGDTAFTGSAPSGFAAWGSAASPGRGVFLGWRKGLALAAGACIVRNPIRTRRAILTGGTND